MVKLLNINAVVLPQKEIGKKVKNNFKFSLQ